MSNKKPISKDLDEWQKQVYAFAYKHSFIELDGERYADAEKIENMVKDISFLAVAYHELVESGGEEIVLVGHTNIMVNAIKSKLDMLYKESLEAVENGEWLINKMLKELNEDGRQTKDSDK